MTYKTIMTRLELGRPNAAVLSVSGDLAAQFGARVVGVSACEPMRLAYGEGAMTAELVSISVFRKRRGKSRRRKQNAAPP